MATQNTNYHSVFLPAGTYTEGTLGNGITASTTHQILCVTAGAITIYPISGTQFTISLTAGQTVNCLTKQVVVGSGTFVAFRSQNTSKY